MTKSDPAAKDPKAQIPKDSFLGIPLKGWAAFAVSLIVVCATLAHYSIRVYGDWQEQKQKADKATDDKEKTIKEKNQLYSVNQITSMTTDLITQEMERHKKDKSGHQLQLYSGSDGPTVATYFESDGCIALTRPGPKLPYLDHPGDMVEWSLGPDVKSRAQPTTPLPSEEPADGSKPSSSGVLDHAPETSQPHFWARDARHLEAAHPPKLLKIQAGCVNPHPWPFQSWWGPANGCFAPLYRKWNDGCTHYQLYNACTGQWDPRIFWTYCNPNHHP